MSQAAWLISGRTFLDWAFCGETIPRDVVKLRCLFCDVPLTISPEGARILEEKRRDPQFDASLCGPACARCVKKAAELKGVNGIEASTQGAALLERSPAARDMFDFLMEKMR